MAWLIPLFTLELSVIFERIRALRSDVDREPTSSSPLSLKMKQNWEIWDSLLAFQTFDEFFNFLNLEQ